MIFLDPLELYVVPAEFKWEVGTDHFYTIFDPHLEEKPIVQLDFKRLDLAQWQDRLFVWPESMCSMLSKGWIAFDKKMKGYLTEEANVIGTESRTSAPVRIPRDKNTYMHVEVEGLFPCGEGAGYAGGILSAAMDGQNVARAIKRYLG